MIVVDTSGLLANYDRHDRHHVEIARIIARPQIRVLSPFVLAELDYLIAKIAGPAAEMIVLDDVTRGAHQLEHLTAEEIGAAKEVIERYADLQLGLADASLVVRAERYRCQDLLTLDQRHFRVVTGVGGKPFRLLPYDDV